MTVLVVGSVVLAGVISTLVAAVVVVRRRFLVLRISGNSMAPAIRDGDLVRARRIGPDEIRVMDIIAIKAPPSNLEIVRRVAMPPTRTPIVQWEEVAPANRPLAEQTVVKRVAAVAGDVIPAVDGLAGAGTVLGPGLVVVLGDNAAESMDSRHFGPVRADGVQGRVELAALRVNGRSATAATRSA
jgi:signal peptidase I